MHWMKYDPNEAATLSVLNPSKPTSGGGNDLAACTASIESLRIVLIDSRSKLLVGYARQLSSCRQVSGGAEKNQGVGLALAHSGFPPAIHHLPVFSRWPPNSYRIADMSLFWKSAFPRELKRS